MKLRIEPCFLLNHFPPAETPPRMSSSSSSNATKQLTPLPDPSRSPDSIASDDGLAVHAPQDGFELRELSQRSKGTAADNECGRLLDTDDSSVEEIEDEEEVLYDAFGEQESGNGRRQGHRRTQRSSGSLKELLFSSKEEKDVIRKLDRYLVGSLAVLYMLSE